MAAISNYKEFNSIYVEIGRLEKSSVKATKKCKICGRPLTSGEVCKNCMDEMNKPLKTQGDKSAAMYVTSKYEK